MEACSTLGSTLLETLDVRVSSNIESKEKMTVSQTKCESWIADVPRGQWSLGRAVKVVEGDNEFVQVVQVQFGGSVVTRSITKI